MGGSVGNAGDRAWRDAEFDRLVDFARGARDPRGGFGWLDAAGAIAVSGPRPLWITARMTHVFALAVLRGRPDAAPFLTHGIEALRGVFADQAHGGFFETAGSPEADKTSYAHAFVVLAASSAVLAETAADADASARALLDDALDIIEGRIWSEFDGLAAESFSRDWTHGEAYRGANSNMHMTEAFLAAADALDLSGRDEDAQRWRDRARQTTARIVDGFARGNGWRIPEHFDVGWQPVPDYHRDQPDHPFRPYGATVGHALEWARLCLQQVGRHPRTDWLLEDAVALFDRAVTDGWGPDGRPGFVYTTDWDGRPVVRDRLHWVVAEATATASALHRATGESRYDELSRQWWAYIDDYVRDLERGSWHHQLDPDNRPVETVWAGKPDTYHAVQATILPDLALDASIAEGVRRARAAVR